MGRVKQITTDLRNEKLHIGLLTHLVASENMSETLATLHTEIVRNAFAAAKLNVVLTGRPQRSTLAQFRSDYSKYLNSYLARINNEVTPDCPLGNTEAQITTHIIVCTARPRHLTPLSL